MKYFKWTDGRQDVFYKKMLLLRFKIFNFGMDMYLLKYQSGTELPIHKDKVDNGSHYRVNVTLKGESDFYCEKYLYKSKYINIFRPDLYNHGLKVKTNTLKLSIGFVKFKKD